MKSGAGRNATIFRNITTSEGDIEFCVYDFIQEIEKRPVIWNKLNIDHQNAAINKQNWQKLANVFIPYFYQLEENEKTEIVEELKKIWLRLKKNLTKQILLHKKNKSVHCHHFLYMEFYLKCTYNKCLKDYATIEELKTLVNNEMHYRAAAGLPPPQHDFGKRPHPNDNIDRPAKRSKQTEISTYQQSSSLLARQSLNKDTAAVLEESYFDPILVCESVSQSGAEDDNVASQFDYRQQQHQQRTNLRIHSYENSFGASNNSNSSNNAHDAHQAFFESIKPTLKKLNDSQKLDFKIEVLKALKKYKLF